MITAAEFVLEARRMVGVPYLHQGRSINSGVDCVGLGLVAAQHGGHDILAHAGVDVPLNYSREPSPWLINLVAKNCRRLTDPIPGSLLVFRIGRARFPHHFAIYTDTGTMIHADGGQKKAVIEQTLGRPWTRWLHSIWALPGVEYP